MLGMLFKFGGEIVEVRIDGFNCLFRTQQFGGAFATIDGLKLDYKGVCREHPDLELSADWKAQAISRFKNKLKEYKNEEERMEYIIEDLGKYGYEPYIKQKAGFRPVRMKGKK